MWVASTLSRAGLIKLERQGWVFMDSAWSAKPWASWRWDPREATQGELQGELRQDMRRNSPHLPCTACIAG